MTVRLLRWLLGRRLVRRALLALAALAILFATDALLVARLFGGLRGALAGGAFVAIFGAVLVAVGALWLRLRARRQRRVRRFESLLALTPRGFEEEVGRLLSDLGYRDVRRVGGPGDLGADLVCRDRHRKNVVVQCKRYAPGRRVGSAEVQAFIGMMTVHHKAERGIFVTTTEFTAPALDLARQHAIELFDGARLAKLVADGG